MSLLIVFRWCYEAISNIIQSIKAPQSCFGHCNLFFIFLNLYNLTTFPAVCHNLYWCLTKSLEMVTLSGRQNSDKWYSQHSSCFSQTPQTWSNILHTTLAQRGKIFTTKSFSTKIFDALEGYFCGWMLIFVPDSRTIIMTLFAMRPKTEMKFNLASQSRPTISHNTFTEKIIYLDLEQIFGNCVIFWLVSVLEDDNVGVTWCFLESVAPLSSLLSPVTSAVSGRI